MPKELAAEETRVETGHEIERIRDIILGPKARDYDERFQSLQQDLQRLQKRIGQLEDRLVDQGSTLSNRVGLEVDGVLKQLTEHSGQVGQQLQELRAEMQHGEDELRQELSQAMQALTNAKVDRLSLADLLAGLAGHLRADSQEGAD